MFLNGGDTFKGRLDLDRHDRGTRDKPIVIASYGEGRATIAAGGGSGIWAYNTAGIKVSNLRVRGSGWGSNNGSGIYFYTDLPNTKLDTVIIERVEVTGFEDGIEIGAWNGTSGYRNVRIRGAVVHDNRENGITVWGYDAPGHTGYAHKNVYIGHSMAYANSGRRSVGNGIIVSNVDGCVIERSVAHDNGIRNTTLRGPVGIWAWRANRVTIQHNESYANRAVEGGNDGGGFGLDGGTTNSIMQYNYSHDNDGAGYLLAQYAGAQPFHSNVVRYNISENDGRRNHYGGIHVWSHADHGIRNAEVLNNTIYTRIARSGTPAGIRVVSRTVDVRIRKNLIATADGRPLLGVVAGQTRIEVQGNAYWSSGAPFRVQWGSMTYASLETFRSTGQERRDGGNTGFSGDPHFTSVGGGITFADAMKLELLRSYRLKPTSPLVGRGLDRASPLVRLFGMHDYFGAPLSNARIGIGAYSGGEEKRVAHSLDLSALAIGRKAYVHRTLGAASPPS